MECQVSRDHGFAIHAIPRPHRAKGMLHLIEVGIGAPASSHPGRDRLDCQSHFAKLNKQQRVGVSAGSPTDHIAIKKLPSCSLGYERSPLGTRIDQALCGEHLECLSDHCSTHAERLDKFIRIDNLTGLEVASRDAKTQLVHDVAVDASS